MNRNRICWDEVVIYVNTEVPVRFERKIIGREFRKSTMWRVDCKKGVTCWNRPKGVGCISDECGF